MWFSWRKDYMPSVADVECIEAFIAAHPEALILDYFPATGSLAGACGRMLGMGNHTVSRIAELNDLARTAMGVASKLVQTPGISALPPADQSRIREKVELFEDFKPSNDPHGEHDFGAFEHDGQRVFWKIDYYDKNLEFGSEHPEDPGQTTRVLTIMLAEEY
jgi:hypothetical protein